MIKTYKDLDAYKESFQLVIEVYNIIKKLPKFEQYDLGSQIRRAAVSIPANIAEGWAKRRFPKEFKHHLDISMGSCHEIQVHLSIAIQLQYLNSNEANVLIQRYDAIGAKLYKLQEVWK